MTAITGVGSRAIPEIRSAALLDRADSRSLPHLPESGNIRRHREALDFTRWVEASLTDIKDRHAAGDEGMEDGQRHDVFLGPHDRLGHSIRPVAGTPAARD